MAFNCIYAHLNGVSTSLWSTLRHHWSKACLPSITDLVYCSYYLVWTCSKHRKFHCGSSCLWYCSWWDDGNGMFLYDCSRNYDSLTAQAGIMTNDMVKIEVRGTYQAYINLLYGGGAAFGATFGGALCDTLGWRWTFWIQIPPVLIILICAYIYVPSYMGA